MENQVLYYSVANKIKSGIAYKPCTVEITAEHFACSTGSVVGMAVGGLVGYAIAAGAHKKNGVQLIPLSEITSVEMKKGFGTAMVYIDTVNNGRITLACFSKKDMEQIFDLLKK